MVCSSRPIQLQALCLALLPPIQSPQMHWSTTPSRTILCSQRCPAPCMTVKIRWLATTRTVGCIQHSRTLTHCPENPQQLPAQIFCCRCSKSPPLRWPHSKESTPQNPRFDCSAKSDWVKAILNKQTNKQSSKKKQTKQNKTKQNKTKQNKTILLPIAWVVPKNVHDEFPNS